MNNKFSIGVVVAIVLQVSAFVWWTAQQAQTIEQLNQQVMELTSRMAVENDIKMQLQIVDILKTIKEHDKWLSENYSDIQDLIYFAMFTENKWADSYANDPSYVRQFGTKAPIK